MKTFQFTLERVLDWRRAELGVEENKLKQLNAAAAGLDQARARLEAQRAGAGLPAGPLDGADLQSLDAWHIALKCRIEALAARRRELLPEMARQQQRLLEARRRLRLLEKLRERRLADWRYELGREEDAAAERPSRGNRRT